MCERERQTERERERERKRERERDCERYKEGVRDRIKKNKYEIEKQSGIEKGWELDRDQKYWKIIRMTPNQTILNNNNFLHAKFYGI